MNPKAENELWRSKWLTREERITYKKAWDSDNRFKVYYLDKKQIKFIENLLSDNFFCAKRISKRSVKKLDDIKVNGDYTNDERMFLVSVIIEWRKYISTK